MLRNTPFEGWEKSGARRTEFPDYATGLEGKRKQGAKAAREKKTAGPRADYVVPPPGTVGETQEEYKHQE